MNANQLCPSCDNEITQDQINISEGVALCDSCGELTKLSQLNYSGVSSEEALEAPVDGASIRSSHDSLKIVISLFSISQFLGSLAVTLFWNGIVSVFLSLAVAAVYYNLIGPVPDWFPTPGLEDGVPIMNDEPMGPGATVFICLFLVPFVVIGGCMIANTLLRIWGTTEVLIAQPLSSVSTGILFLRLRRRFDPAEVVKVQQSVGRITQNDRTSYIIEITSSKTTKFGMLLSSPQQEWLVAVLRSILIHKKVPKNAHHLTWLS